MHYGLSVMRLSMMRAMDSDKLAGQTARIRLAFVSSAVYSGRSGRLEAAMGFTNDVSVCNACD